MYVRRMEDILKLYARRHDPKEPVVALDERPVVLRSDAYRGIPARRGKVFRRDHEYVRKGTANVFCIVEPLTGRRLTHATTRRTGHMYAGALRKIARRYKKARKIHLVQDNLNTHSEKSLIRRYGAKEGRRIWSRFSVHFTPLHASWLNAAELEASLMARECLGRRRIPDAKTLKAEVRAWRIAAEKQGRKIRWSFTVNDAKRVFRYRGIETSRSKH